MLPYFKYTEGVQTFCELMGFTVELYGIQSNGYVCMYSLESYRKPHITVYNLSYSASPLIPPDKVLIYLTLMLNGYSYKKAVNELNVVG